MTGLLSYLKDRRHGMVLPHVRGRLLDIGCGNNLLVRAYAAEGAAADRGAGFGVGVDVHPWDGVDRLVEDTSRLPFADGSFDTVTFLACLNHIPNRLAVLREARRCLSPGGTLLATMIPPTASRLFHVVIRPWDADQYERGMKPGEVWGFTRPAMRQLFLDAGFEVTQTVPFVFRLNTLYICRPAPVAIDASSTWMGTAAADEDARAVCIPAN